jgi:predicted translin family RNA/ssDNA-binding protein
MVIGAAGLLVACSLSLMKPQENTNDSIPFNVEEVQHNRDVLNDLARIIANFDAVDQTAAEASQQVRALQASVAELRMATNEQRKFDDEHVTKLVTTILQESEATKAEVSETEACQCAEKLAAMQAEINALKARFDEHERLAKETATKYGSYGTASPSASTSSGGSTGSVKASTSTSTNTVVKSGGSTGSVSYQVSSNAAPVYAEPASIEVQFEQSDNSTCVKMADGTIVCDPAAAMRTSSRVRTPKTAIGRALDRLRN